MSASAMVGASKQPWATPLRQALTLGGVSIVGSNVFSNVSFVLVAGKWIPAFARPELMWKVLAGNLTIMGSVANIIVVASARGHLEVGFWDCVRCGIPVTLATTTMGLVVLLLPGQAEENPSGTEKAIAPPEVRKWIHASVVKAARARRG